MEREKNYLNYEAPVVEIIEVEVEKGFAASTPMQTTSEGLPGFGNGGDF